MHPSDKELIEAGTEIAFTKIYLKYWKQLYTKAYNKLQNEDEAKDIVQDIFLSFWRNKDQIKVDDSLGPYFFAALRYSVIKKISRKVSSLSIEVANDITVQDVVEKYQLKQLQILINRQVQQFPERMREIYELSKNYNLTNKEIAERLHISEQTVKNTLVESMKRLRRTLSIYRPVIFLLIFFKNL